MFNQNIRQSRTWSLLVIFAVYVLAALAGYAAFGIFRSLSFLIRLAAADMTATVVVWLFSIIFVNSSVYDPYWSVAPPVMLGCVIAGGPAVSPVSVLILGIIVIWSVRLTFNWAANFPNLTVQDWRYAQLKVNYPKIWIISNLFGIHVMPTIVVFLCLIPAVYSLERTAPINPFTLVFACLCLLAVYLEAVSDRQMYRFRAVPANSGKVNRQGIWRYSRHPNYLGEILMWWGVWGMAQSSGPLPVYAVAGPVAVTLLFVFISIPMMEKRQIAQKPAYRQYIETTGMLLPFRRALPARSQSETNS